MTRQQVFFVSLHRIFLSELKQKQLEYSFLLLGKVHSHVKPLSHETSAFAFSSNVKNGVCGNK